MPVAAAAKVIPTRLVGGNSRRTVANNYWRGALNGRSFAAFSERAINWRFTEGQLI
eukprot:COSAG06_NODE_3737_length_4958_cov_13.429718_1_plen_56_part_00